jgi:hypothetical protein
MRNRQCFGRNAEVKRELGKCSSRWQDDIKVDGKEIRCSAVHLIILVNDGVSSRAVVITVTNIRRLLKTWEFY